MAQNVQPVFGKIPEATWGFLQAANTAKDGTGTVTTVFTADAVNGSFIFKIRARPRGTNVASVLRVFINNGATNATATNNVLFDELGLVATTISENSVMTGQELSMNIPLPAGYKINVTLGTAVAAGWDITVLGMDY